MKCAWLAVAWFALALPAGAGEGKTVRVARGDLEVTVKVGGVITAEPAGRVVLTPKGWTGRYVVAMAREPGTPVKAGDVVLRFDGRELGEAIDDARFELELAERSLGGLLEQHRLKAEEAVEGLDGLKLALARAELRRDGYLRSGKPRREEKARLDRESSAFRLANVREELRQLEKMYAEDQMVDETEEIVLKRARWNVKYREGLHGMLLASQAFDRKYSIPQQEEDLDRDVRLKRAALDRGLRSARLDTAKREAEEMRARRSLDRRRRDLGRLVADLERMTVRAPCDGILVHGPWEGSLTRVFRRGARVSPGDPVATILDPDRPVIEATVPARAALRLSPGLALRFTPSAEGAEAGTAKITWIARLPRDGAYRVRCRPDRPLPPALLGVGVEGLLVVERVERALLLPAAAVRQEGERTFCRVLPAEGAPPVDLDVVTGPNDGKRIVVRAGLKEGDLVLLPAGKE